MENWERVRMKQRMRHIAKFIENNLEKLDNGDRIRFISKNIRSAIKLDIGVLEREKVFGDRRFHVDYEKDVETNKYQISINGDKIMFIEIRK